MCPDQALESPPLAWPLEPLLGAAAGGGGRTWLRLVLLPLGGRGHSRTWSWCPPCGIARGVVGASALPRRRFVAGAAGFYWCR